jgi:hypothetical protein
MNDKHLIITAKIVYGKVLLYPSNELAEKFATLVGRKTFLEGHLLTITDLGYSVERRQENLLGGSTNEP